MSVAIIPDFVKYQIEWLTSHNDLEFEPVIEDAIVQMLKDTGKSFIDEQAAETSHIDHTADIGKKVSIPCAHENDCISRQAAIDAVIDELKRSPTPAIRAKFRLEALPPAQPESHWIPCSARLPEERGFYLTTTKDKAVYCDHWNEDNFDRTEMVIAWQPIPEPYKGGEKE